MYHIVLGILGRIKATKKGKNKLFYLRGNMNMCDRNSKPHKTSHSPI